MNRSASSALTPRHSPALKWAAALFLFVNITLVLAGKSYRRAAELTVTFLDVGQGDAAVIETPGGRTVLIDTGGISSGGQQDEGRAVVEPYLRTLGVNHIDAIVLTHPHADHIGGADTLITDFNTDMVIDNGEPTEPPLELKLLADAAARHTSHKTGIRGEEIDLGDGVKAEMIAPSPREVADDRPNNASIVLRLTYGRTSFLFEGDAEMAEEADMVAAGSDLKCDVLKVGHHGSDTSSTPAFLSAARPGTAIISVGKHNRYGHPSAEVVRRLGAMGAHVYRTDENGAVTCVSDGSTVKVTCMKGR